MYKCFIDLVVYPPSAVIKVDDTEPGIAEGVAARGDIVLESDLARPQRP